MEGAEPVHMALRLRIVSDHRRALGKRASVVFGVTGGNIGRSADNDWVLPDPSRFVSGRHARVKFDGGRYFLEDTSTNGTYINDSDQPMPRSTPHELKNGDMLRLGEYHVTVALDPDNDFGAGRGGAMVNLDSTLEEGSGYAQQIAGSLDVSFDPNKLFETGNAVIKEQPRASAVYGQSMLLEGSGERRANGPATPAAQATDDSNIVAARRLERLTRAVRDREPAPTAGNARAGLEEFCRGAGIDPANLPEGNPGAILQIAGRLLREALISLKVLDAKQAEFRRQFRLPPVRDADRQPFQLAGSTDDLLTALFVSHGSRRTDAGQWLRACYDQQATHQEALASGARDGCLEFMRQLSPAELERRFATTAKRGAPGAKPNHWELYTEYYRSASEVQPDTGVPSLYGETLASAYSTVFKKQSG